MHAMGFPGGSVIRNLPANAEHVGSIPGSGRSPEGGNGNPLQYSCLGNSMDREAFWATVHGVAELDITEHVRAGTQTHTDTHTHTHTPDSLCCTPETNTTL